ncbi:MAG TPA: tetratricopeptide repeat protein [Bosea sp. (in: a-proteobacteria)]|uniref:tetratricopeptide repeat protein n=1 Tax=Bosea sp. (in: a-proteobacteria) TaxID=1871050 RepID=UPI002E115128|nr:tetratricopeptide repeat protein [Bosea sp. (in: a-proteobacteria)]
MTDTLFRSGNLLVKAALRPGEACVVTFDPYTDEPKLDRLAFGEAVCAAAGIAAIHVVNRRNAWYQEPEWRDMVAAVAAATKSYHRVLAYGSSMGGYAALRFGSMIGATGALAISPQYSLHPRKADFDTRWAATVHDIYWQPELAGPLPADLPAVVVYDPAHRLDRCHVDLIAREMPVRRIALPFSGHPSGTYLGECGLLLPLVLRTLAGETDFTDVTQSARDHRRNSTSYFVALARAAGPRNPERAVAFARRALELNPTAYATWVTLAEQLRFAGRIEEALAALERAVVLTQEHPEMLRVLSNVLHDEGRFDEAAAALARSLAAAGSADLRGLMRLARFKVLGQVARMRSGAAQLGAAFRR